MICSTQHFNSCPIGCTLTRWRDECHISTNSKKCDQWEQLLGNIHFTKHGTSSPLKTIKKQPSYHLINNHLKSISFWSLQSWSIRHEAGEGRRRRACTHSMATEIEGFKPYRPTSNLAHAVHSPFFRQRARAPIHQNLRACTVHTPPPPWQSPLPPSHKIQIFKNCAHQTLCKKNPPPQNTHHEVF